MVGDHAHLSVDFVTAVDLSNLVPTAVRGPPTSVAGGALPSRSRPRPFAHGCDA
jgi:hypothetical protein